MNGKYIEKAITKALTMPHLPNGRPFAVQRGESMSVYCDNYCCWAVPAGCYELRHNEECTLTTLIPRLSLDPDLLHEVFDTGRREIRTGKKKHVIAVLACDDFEIFVNEGMLKLFSSLNCRYWAKSPESMLIVQDADWFSGYGVGGIMPVKKNKGE